MTTQRRWLRGLILAAILVVDALLLSQSRAQESPDHLHDHAPVDVAIVLDSSGSMRGNDPDFLRVPAAQMLIQLLRGDDRAAVVSFSDQAWPIRRLSSTRNAEQRDQLAGSLRQVSNRGQLTNLHDAVAGTMRLFDAAPGSNRRVIVLMTDGVMDVGDAGRDTQLRQAMLEELAPELRARGIELHSIAFTRSSDQRLLESLSQAADGQAYLAESAEDLPPVFQAIFENLKQPDALPVTAGGFLVDASVNELTAIIPEAGGVALLDPDGRRLDSRSSDRVLRWHENPAYTMVTIQAPAAGRWQIEAENANASDVYILTDFQLQLAYPEGVSSGETFELAAWLSDADGPVSDGRLDPFRFSVRADDSADWQSMRAQQDSARAHWRTAFEQPGQTRVTVRAQAPTVERERTFNLEVVPGVPTEAEPVPQPAVETVAEAESGGSDEPSSPVPEESIASEPEASAGWHVWVLRGAGFVLVNGLLIAAWWFYRRRRREPSEALDALDSGMEEARHGDA